MSFWKSYPDYIIKKTITNFQDLEDNIFEFLAFDLVIDQSETVEEAKDVLEFWIRDPVMLLDYEWRDNVNKNLPFIRYVGQLESLIENNELGKSVLKFSLLRSNSTFQTEFPYQTYASEKIKLTLPLFTLKNICLVELNDEE